MRRATLLFLIALGVNIAIVVGARFFPFEDSTNHLARYVLLERAWWGHGAPFITTRAVPGPYLGADAIGAVLVHWLGAAWAARAMSAFVVAAIPLGFYWLLAAVGGDRAADGWAMVGVLLGFGFFTHAGFVPYAIGAGAALAWLAAWWPHREQPSAARGAALVAGIIGCYLMHLSSALIVLTVVWLDAVLARDRRIRVVLALTAAVGAMSLWSYLGAPPAPAGAVDGGVAFSPLVEKAKNVLTPFYVYSAAQAAVMLAAYVLAVTMFLRRNAAASRWRGTWGAAAAAFAALYVVFPSATSGGGYLDLRWLIPAYLLLFCVAGAETKGPSRVGLALLFAGSIASSVVLWRTVRQIDRYLDDYASLLAALPPGRTLFPVVADDQRFGARIIPYRHFALWYEINDGGRVPGLFNFGGDGYGSTPNWFMPYFDEPAHLYAPPMGWFGGKVRRIDPLDWARIASGYDYVVVAGRDSTIRAEVEAHGREVVHVGEIAAYTAR